MAFGYDYVISFLLAFIVAFAVTPAAKKLAFKVGAVDIPRDDRRMHKKPTARFGGLAIIAGFLFSLFFNYVNLLFGAPSPLIPGKELAAFLAGTAVLTVMGVLDDIYQLRSYQKLPFQVTAALLVVAAGTRVEYVTNPFAYTGMSKLNTVLSFAVSTLWIVGVTNALNFIDGLDGLAAGVSSIASLSLFFVSLTLENSFTALLTVMLAGATLGFLPYNFNPAKIFMADTGANFLGFALAVISIEGTLKSYTAISIAIPLLVLGLPLFDTAFAILRRLKNGKPIMQADRGHLHHRLVDMGLSQKQSVAVMYMASTVLGLIAVVLAIKGALSAIVLVVALSVLFVAGTRFMTSINAGNGKNGSGTDSLDGKQDCLSEEIAKK